MKSLVDQFVEAVTELKDLAGDNEILKKQLTSWVNKNFRLQTTTKSLSSAELKLAHIKDIVRFRTESMVSQFIGQLSKSGDAPITNHRQENGDVAMRVEVITFIARTDEDVV